MRRQPISKNSILLSLLALGTSTLAAQKPHTIIVRGMNYAFQVPDTVPAGLTGFSLDNQGTVRHELVLVRLKEGHTLSDVMAATTPEQRLALFEDFIGVIFAQPGTRGSGSLLAELKGGTYVLVCNLRDAPDKPTHLAQGMVHMLHVR